MPWIMLVLTSERKNFDRAYCHSHAEDDSGDGLLGLAFAIGEHQPSDHDCDQRQAGRNRAGKGGFENIDRVFPRIAAALGVYGQCRKEEQRRRKPPPPVRAQRRKARARTFHVNEYFHVLLSFA